MVEQTLIYFINFVFIYSLYKGFFKGGTSQLFSLIFLIIAFFLATYVFDNTFYRTVISIGLFLTIYTIGLFFSYLMEKQSGYEKMTGILIGILNFFTLLTMVTILALFMNSVPEIYKNNFFVSIIYPNALYIHKVIKEKKKNIRPNF